MTDMYVLVNGKPVQEPDLLKWAEFFENTANRRVAYDAKGEKSVSTIFLGLDHNFFGGEPILYESMLFVDGKGGEMQRYSTEAEALKGHAEFCAKYL